MRNGSVRISISIITVAVLAIAFACFYGVEDARAHKAQRVVAAIDPQQITAIYVDGRLIADKNSVLDALRRAHWVPLETKYSRDSQRMVILVPNQRAYFLDIRPLANGDDEIELLDRKGDAEHAMANVIGYAESRELAAVLPQQRR